MIMEIRENKAGRNVLVNLFKDKVSVEVGTERGHYAKKLAQVASKLYVVDLWKNYPGYREHVSDEMYETILQEAHKRLDKYDVGFIRTDSVSASELFEDEYIGALYLDANHEYQSAYDDLCAWYPKVKKGGIIAGHDFYSKTHKDVRRAVIDFCMQHGIEELTEWTGDRSHSFHFVKN